MPTMYQIGVAGSHGYCTSDRTCLQDLTGIEHQTEPAYKVSSRGCRISRVGNNRSYMPTRYQEVTAGSHGFETPDRIRLRGIRTGLQDLTGWDQQIQHAYNVSGRGCMILRAGNYRSYIPTRLQEGTSGSHEFETPERTCLLCVRTALYDLTGSEHNIVHAYKVSIRRCKISRVQNTRSYMPTGYQEGAAGSHG